MGEISLWKGVVFHQIRQFLFSYNSGGEYNTDQYAIERMLLKIYLQDHDSVLMFSSPILRFKSKKAIKSSVSIMDKQDYLFIRDYRDKVNSNVIAQGYSSSVSDIFRIFVDNAIDCLDPGNIKCDRQMDTFAREFLISGSKQGLLSNMAIKVNSLWDVFMAKTTLGKGAFNYCEISMNEVIMNSDFKLNGSNVPRRMHGDKKTIISIGVPSIGRGIGTEVRNASLIRSFLPKFLKSVGKSEKDDFEFWIYVAYDQGDPIYDNPKYFPRLQTLANDILSNSSFVKLQFVRLPQSNAWLTYIWNALYVKSLEDGTDYFFQVNDDLEIKTQGWASAFVKKLRDNNDIGKEQKAHSSHPMTYPLVRSGWSV